MNEAVAPECTFASVTPQNAVAVWDMVRPMIERALVHDYDGMTSEQILARILLDDLTLLIVERRGEIIACMTLEWVHRRERICHCMTFAGDDMETWVDDFIDAWRAIGKEAGCRYLSIKGRKGWERYAAKRFGFAHAYTLMYLDLEE